MSQYWGGVTYEGNIDNDDPLPQAPVKIPKKRYAFKSAKIWKRIINEALRHFAVHRDYRYVRHQSDRLGKEAQLSRRSRCRTA